MSRRAIGGRVGRLLPTSDFLQEALCASVCKRACKPPSRRRRVHATVFYVGRGGLLLLLQLEAHGPTNCANFDGCTLELFSKELSLAILSNLNQSFASHQGSFVF